MWPGETGNKSEQLVSDFGINIILYLFKPMQPTVQCTCKWKARCDWYSAILHIHLTKICPWRIKNRPIDLGGYHWP